MASGSNTQPTNTQIHTKMKLHSDHRYTVTLEFCGEANPQWIVRFCGEWVSKHANKGAALIRAVGEAARRRDALVLTERR